MYGRHTLNRPASTTQRHSAAALKPSSAARGESTMPDNRISASLSQADRQAVLDAINTIRTKLPFLIDLSPEERRSLPRMGDKSRGFVAQALEVAEQNPDILPRSFDVAEMRKDVELLAALSPVLAALAQLNELVDDTVMAVGSEAYAAALLLYQFARAAGKGSALDTALDSLGQRFARKSTPRAPSDKTTPNQP
jgi:hypothetical protein